MNALCRVLSELEPTLAPGAVETPGPHDDATLTAKQALLELWYHLLDTIERVPPPTVAPVVFAVILGVVKRPEFDLTRIAVDARGRFVCPEHELLLAQRYRHLLCQTTRYAANMLSDTVPLLPDARALREFRAASGGTPAPPPSDESSGGGGGGGIHGESSSTGTATETEETTGTNKDPDEKMPSETQIGDEDDSAPERATPAKATTTTTTTTKEKPKEKEEKRDVASLFNLFGLAKSQLPAPLLAFATRLLAVAYWRLAAVREDIVGALRAESASLGAIAELRSAAALELCSPGAFPLLLQWDDFHARVQEVLHEPASATRLYTSTAWLAHVTVYGEFFVALVHEWLQYVHSVVGARHIAWSRFPGYGALAGRFVQLRATAPQRALTSRQTFQAELALLTTDNPLVVNHLLHGRFGATSVAALSAVLETLSALDVWFAELGKSHFFLGDPFDMPYFCAGLDAILAYDHHVAVAKALQLVYTHSDRFVGRNRLALFGDLLLERHFFDLFLHWDDNVRMIFIQLLVFKMLRSKRRSLQSGPSPSSSSSSQAPQQQGQQPQQLQGQGQQDDKCSPRAIDMLLYVKIEAYMNIVRRALAESKKSLAQQKQQQQAQAQAQGQTRPKKKYVVEESDSDGADDAQPEQQGAACHDVPPGKMIYLSKACSLYDRHMFRYEEWQNRANAPMPPLVTLS